MNLREALQPEASAVPGPVCVQGIVGRNLMCFWNVLNSERASVCPGDTPESSKSLSGSVSWIHVCSIFRSNFLRKFLQVILSLDKVIWTGNLDKRKIKTFHLPGYLRNAN